MSILPPPKLWLEQARADLAAARAAEHDQPECYARYWLQQAYEKAVKGYLIAQMSADSEEVEQIQRDTILKSHSPLSDFPPSEDLSELEERLRRQYPQHWARGIGRLKVLRRFAQSLIKNCKHSSVLMKIDAAKPSIRSDFPSIRYPFLDGRQWYSPSRWSGWDGYQGPRPQAFEAVEELLEFVKATVGTGGRRRLRLGS